MYAYKMERNIDSENNIIKNIAGEIVRECAHQGSVVTNDLADYVVRLKLLDPSHGYTATHVMDRSLTQQLVAECVAQLLKDTCSMSCVRLQTYWMSHDLGRDRIKENHRKAVLEKTRPVLKEILDIGSTNKEDSEKIYRKIVVYTIMSSGLGNPTVPSVLREATPALHSIFKSSQLESFTAMSRREKEEHLAELTQIVTGIRIFNKDSQKGGESIDDLPVLLVQAVAATSDRLTNAHDALRNRITQLMAVIEAVHHVSDMHDAEHDADQEYFLPPETTQEDVSSCKKILIIMRQHQKHIFRLQEDLEQCRVVVVNVVDQLQKTLLQLHEVVRYRSAIPTVQVYPLFIDLSFIWKDLQEETSILSHINTVAVQMKAINKYFQPTRLELAMPDVELVSDEDIAAAASKYSIELPGDANPGVVLINPADTNIDFVEIEFDGNCAWSVAQVDGYVVPGNVSIGVLQYHAKHYLFCDFMVAGKWSRAPDRYILRAYSIARLNVELVHYLQVYDNLDAVRGEILTVDEREAVEKVGKGTQTVLHPVKSYIDKDYTYSEWVLKRRAIQLANMAKCVTKSVQTVNHSHFRAHIGIQVHPDQVRRNFLEYQFMSKIMLGLIDKNALFEKVQTQQSGT